MIAALGLSAFGWFRTERRLAEQADQLAATQTAMEQVLGEVTRLRIEQSSDSKGPQALLEKLRVYAPMTADSRVTEPDYQNARKEMRAIIRAFESLGQDAWAPINERLLELDARKDHDEIKQLLEAAIVVDPKAGKQILKDVLLGHRLPSPKLRWSAARILRKHDLPLAQQLLRTILLTESYRGVNPERAAANNLPIPDAQAVAVTGFHNFVVAYIRTDDPKTEETLLMVLGRVEHDAITIQECIEELGRRKCQRAVDPIKNAYRNPPLKTQNPIFLMRCLGSLFEIQGEAARPFLEQALPDATTDTVARYIQSLLNKLE